MVSLVAEQAEHPYRVNAREEYAEVGRGNRENGRMRLLEDNRARGEQNERGNRAEFEAALAPNLVEYLAKTVQAAPNNKVPAGTVPPTAHNLGGHGVHVGGNELARFGPKVGDNRNVGEQEPKHNAHEHAARKHNGHKAQERHPEIRAHGGVAVTAQRNVEVVAPPT